MAAPPTSPLFAAIAARDVDAVRRLLASGVSPRLGDGRESPLHLAARRGPLAVVEALLAGGALEWQPDAGGRIPLDVARRSRSREHRRRRTRDDRARHRAGRSHVRARTHDDERLRARARPAATADARAAGGRSGPRRGADRDGGRARRTRCAAGGARGGSSARCVDCGGPGRRRGARTAARLREPGRSRTPSDSPSSTRISPARRSRSTREPT